MASTYSALKIELIATGEQVNVWGATTNTNLGTALEQAIVGRTVASFTTDGNLTIDLTNTNTTQVARHYILNLTSTGALTATRDLIVPSIDKPYIIENNTTGGQSIRVKTAAGTGITVPNGKTAMVYANSTNVVSALSYVPALSIDTATINGGTITGITDLAVADGGTGLSALTANNVILGNGTSAPTFVAPSTSGNVLTSNGTTWTSLAIPAPATVSSFSAGSTGFTPNTTTTGAVTLAGTLATANGGTGVTAASTGTGGVVLSTSPTLVTPALGTPASGVLTNCTGTVNALNAGIGVNQTYSTPARVYSTTYTNSGTKPIFVIVCGSNTTPNVASAISLLVDSVVVAIAKGGGTGSGMAANTEGTVVTGIIPVGSTYSVTPTSSTLEKWSELS